MWIYNALLYAIVLCLLGYVVMWSTFEDYGLFSAGTAVYTALCMALQWKVAYLHHMWTWVNVLMMAISVGGMLLYFYILNVLSDDYVDDFYNEANYLYNQPVYWFMCFFSIPVFVALIDLIGYGAQLFFQPTLEMLYREFSLEVCRPLWCLCVYLC